MKSRREKYKESLTKRTEESFNTKDDSGRFKSIFKDDLGITTWVVKEGEHEIDIIPYMVGKNDPRVMTGKLEVGDISYSLNLWVHQGIGVTQDNYVCLSQNYRKPCPVCEFIEEQKNDEGFDEDLIKSLYAKKRVVYNVIVRDSIKEEEKGVQILEIAHWFMERHLVGIAKKPREGGFIPFSDPDEGKIIFFERAGSGKENTSYIRHQFIDRKTTISDENLDKAKCLDSLIYIPSYNELSTLIGFSKHVETPGKGKEDKEEKQKETEDDDIPAWDRKDWTSDSEEEEEQEEESLSCYEGGVLGKDYKKYTGCEECPVFIECRTKNKHLKVKLQEQSSTQKNKEEKIEDSTKAASSKAPQSRRRM